jgi:hypothetical protein
VPTIVQFRPGVSPYRFGQILRNEEYVFDVRWNSRDAAWYFDVRESDLTPIALGLKVAMGAYLGRRSNHPLFSDGVMVARPVGSDRRPPGFLELGGGGRVQVMYFTRIEAYEQIVGSITGGPTGG